MNNFLIKYKFHIHVFSITIKNIRILFQNLFYAIITVRFIFFIRVLSVFDKKTIKKSYLKIYEVCAAFLKPGRSPYIICI